MTAEGRGNVGGCRHVPHGDQDRDSGKASGAGNDAQHTRATANPTSFRRHRGAQQQRHRRITWHGVILLRGREGEKNQDESGPAKRQQTGAAGAINGLEREVCNRWKINTPRKKPDEVKQPEPQARHGIVIAWIARVEKSQQLLVDEVEPQESVIVSGQTL